MNPLRFVAWIPGYIAWVASALLALPYFQYFLSGQPVHGLSKTGSRWVFDPAKDGWALLVPFVIVTIAVVAAIVWKRGAIASGVRRAAEEEAWTQTLPFRVLGHPEAVGAHDHRYKIAVYFKERRPSESLLAMLPKVDTCLALDGMHGERALIVADYPSTDPPARNAQRFATTMHELTDRVLRPLHAEHPIDRVEVSA